MPENESYYVILIEADVEPELYGPYRTEVARDQVAREMRSADPDGENGIFRLEIDPTGLPRINTYSAAELDCDELAGDTVA